MYLYATNTSHTILNIKGLNYIKTNTTCINKKSIALKIYSLCHAGKVHQGSTGLLLWILPGTNDKVGSVRATIADRT